MSFSAIREKYKKYNLEYDVRHNMLFIYRDIPVKVFLELKADLILAGIELDDIRVYGR